MKIITHIIFMTSLSLAIVQKINANKVLIKTNMPKSNIQYIQKLQNSINNRYFQKIGTSGIVGNRKIERLLTFFTNDDQQNFLLTYITQTVMIYVLNQMKQSQQMSLYYSNLVNPNNDINQKITQKIESLNQNIQQTEYNIKEIKQNMIEKQTQIQNLKTRERNQQENKLYNNLKDLIQADKTQQKKLNQHLSDITVQYTIFNKISVQTDIVMKTLKQEPHDDVFSQQNFFSTNNLDKQIFRDYKQANIKQCKDNKTKDHQEHIISLDYISKYLIKTLEQQFVKNGKLQGQNLAQIYSSIEQQFTIPLWQYALECARKTNETSNFENKLDNLHQIIFESHHNKDSYNQVRKMIFSFIYFNPGNILLAPENQYRLPKKNNNIHTDEDFRFEDIISLNDNLFHNFETLRNIMQYQNNSNLENIQIHDRSLINEATRQKLQNRINYMKNFNDIQDTQEQSSLQNFFQAWKNLCIQSEASYLTHMSFLDDISWKLSSNNNSQKQYCDFNYLFFIQTTQNETNIENVVENNLNKDNIIKI